jgi:Outer membrane protein beta-barrel domain
MQIVGASTNAQLRGVIAIFSLRTSNFRYIPSVSHRDSSRLRGLFQEKAFSMSIRARVLSLAIALMVIVPAAAKAQMSPVSAGIKGGINSATLSNDTDESLDQLIGGVGGVFIGRDINKNFGLQLEGLYSMRGAKAEGGDAKIKLNYIDVPVLARLGSQSANGNKFYAFTGPQASFKVTSEVEFLGETDDLDDEVESFDFGWTAGVGADMGRVTLDARYTMGLMNIDKTGDDTIKNRTFSVMVGFRLK